MKHISRIRWEWLNRFRPSATKLEDRFCPNPGLSSFFPAMFGTFPGVVMIGSENTSGDSITSDGPDSVSSEKQGAMFVAIPSDESEILPENGLWFTSGTARPDPEVEASQREIDEPVWFNSPDPMAASISTELPDMILASLIDDQVYSPASRIEDSSSAGTGYGGGVGGGGGGGEVVLAGGVDDRFGAVVTNGSDGGAVAAAMPADNMSSSAPSTMAAPQLDSQAIQQMLAALPLSFEPNVGQTDAQADFLARGSGYILFLTPGGATLGLSNPEGGSGDLSMLTMNLVGSDPEAEATGLEQLEGKVNYFIGNDPSQWHTGIATFGKVEYQEVYAGIDLVYYGNQGQLEYDFVVAPGASPGDIVMSFAGADELSIDERGNLVIQVGDAQLVQQAPVIYQEINGARQGIAGDFTLLGQQQVGFDLGSYDQSVPLIIDPVLVYSTYLGGTQLEEGFGIAVDSNGNAYVTGETNSNDFPTLVRPPARTDFDAFVVKMNPQGGLAYATYLGGGQKDQGLAIAIDSAGNAYVTGGTKGDFPTVNAYRPNYLGGTDAFMAKLNAQGDNLLYSTYLGGGALDLGMGIAVDSSGNAYLTGETFSADFPMNGKYQVKNGLDDGFVVKIDPNQAGEASRIYSTYLGHDGNDSGTAIAVDSAGNAYVTGATTSVSFPTTTNAYRQQYKGGQDAFVTEFNATGTDLLYSTFLGGSKSDEGHGIAVKSGQIYVTGLTASTDFPSKNAYQAANGGLDDAFVTRFDPSKAGEESLLYSTYLGGSGSDDGRGIAVDSGGYVYVAGETRSPNFPIKNPLPECPQLSGLIDAFVTKLDVAQTDPTKQLVYSTFLGGKAGDGANSIAVDADGNAYVTGDTASDNFPLKNPYQNILKGANDAFVVKIAPNGPPQGNDDNYQTNQDTPLSVPDPGVLSNDTDPEGDPLSAVLLYKPPSMSLIFYGSGGFLYTPSPGFVGVQSFTYLAYDGVNFSHAVTVTITVVGS